MGPKVFQSYSSEGKTIANRVCSALEAADIPCWIAPRNILPGVDYPTAIVEAISSVEVLVLILNRQAAASPHIRSEVGQAFNDKKRIIPFRLFNDRLPENLEYFLSMTQWRDDTDGCTDENIKRLTEAILDPLAGGERGTIQAHRRPTMMAVAFVLLALLASARYIGDGRSRVLRCQTPQQAYYGMPPRVAWFAENSGGARHPVGGKLPNAFGLYDMLGNAGEWVLDRYYEKYYLDSPAAGPNVDQPLASNATAVARGGFWGSDAKSVRVSQRSEQETDAEDDTIGFR
jgi:hypothetical protein